MSLSLISIASKFDELAIREKLLIVGAIIGLSYVALDFIALQPLNKELKTVKEKESTAQKEQVSLNAEISVFEKIRKKGPNSDLKQKLSKLQNKLTELDRNLKTLSVGLVSAEDLPILLHDVLQKTRKLKIINMETLPTQEILLGSITKQAHKGIVENADELDNEVLSQSLKDSDAARTEERIKAGKTKENESVKINSVRLFKHGVSITLRGSYKDVSGYIAEIESGKWRFYWDSLGYHVKSYPKAEIKLQVYTLASERGVFDAG